MLYLMPAKALQCPQKKCNLRFRDYNSTTKMEHATLGRTQNVFRTPRHAEGIKTLVSGTNKMTEHNPANLNMDSVTDAMLVSNMCQS